MALYSLHLFFLTSASAAVSPLDTQFVVHDPFCGARIFGLDGSDNGSQTDALIPYNGPRIAVPIVFWGPGQILISESGTVKVYDSDCATNRGRLAINCGLSLIHFLTLFPNCH
jgi:hypothetical protein